MRMRIEVTVPSSLRIPTLAGVLMVAFGSYRDFQNDSMGAIDELKTRVAVIENRMQQADSRLDRQADVIARHLQQRDERP